MIQENTNDKIVIIDTINNEIKVISNNNINWNLLDNEYDGNVEEYIMCELGHDSNCHWFITNDLKINID